MGELVGGTGEMRARFIGGWSSAALAVERGQGDTTHKTLASKQTAGQW